MSGNGSQDLVDEGQFRVMEPPPEPEGWVVLQPEPYTTRYALTHYPNWWHRFWCRVCFGWRFERND